MYASTTQEPSDPSTAASVIVTFLPLALLMVMFVLFFAYLRRARSNVDESLKLSREMLAELRAIRHAVERQPGPPQP